MSIVKSLILAGEAMSKILLAVLLVLDTKFIIHGMTILLIMWLPALFLVLNDMITMRGQNSKMSPAQIVLIIILFPFLPTLTSTQSVYNTPLPSQVQSNLSELMTFPQLVSSPLQMVLIMSWVLTGDIKIDGELVIYLHFCDFFVVRFITFIISGSFDLRSPLLHLHHHLCKQSQG